MPPFGVGWMAGHPPTCRRKSGEVLHTNTADFIAFADALRTLNRRGEAVRAVLGGDKPIRASGLFEDISEL